MSNSKLPLLLVFLILFSAVSLSHAVSESIVFPNGNEVVSGTLNAGQLITGTCVTGIGTNCVIEIAGSTTPIANAVPLSSTVTISANNPLITANVNANGYISLVTNDLTGVQTTSPNTLRLISGLVANAVFTITNNQGAAVSSGTQILVPYNAVQFQNVESNSLNNTFFYFQNGTVVSSWLEGNLLNEIGNANVLYQSANVIYWIVTPSQASGSFLGGTSSNIIEAGWVSQSTNLMDGNYIGESSQLANTVSTTVYGTYDNGAKVFTSYQNWGSLSGLPSGWSQTAGAQVTFGTTNTQVLNNVPGGQAVSNSIYINAPYSTNTVGNTLSALINFSYGGSAGSTGGQLQVGTTTFGSQNNCQIGIGLQSLHSMRPCIQGFTQSGPIIIQKNPGVYSLSLVNSINEGNYLVSYNSVIDLIHSGTIHGKYLQISSANNLMPISIYWLRTSINQPGNTMPMITNSPINILLQIIKITPSTTTVYDSGGKINITTYVLGGTQPYIYNFIVFNSITNIVIANKISGTNSFILSVNNIMVTNTYKANVIVTDSATVNDVANSVNSGLLEINSNPIITVKATNTLLDSGQLIQFTVNELGGSGNFNALLLNLTPSSTYPTQQNQIVSIQINKGNVIQYNSQKPTYITLPSADNIIRIIPITLTNIQPVNSSNNYQIPITLNALNYSNYLNGNANNLVFFYSNGTIVNSILTGNYYNYTNAKNLNESNSLEYTLKINPQIKEVNLTGTYNNKILNDTNQASCNATDSQVQNPVALHGIYVLAPQKYLTVNTPAYAYVINDSRWCGSILQIGYNKIVSKVGNTLIWNWTIINKFSANWTLHNKKLKVDFLIGSLDNNGTGNNLPGYIANLSQDITCPSPGTQYPTPILWNSLVTSGLKVVISNITQAAANGTLKNISSFQFGIGFTWDQAAAPPGGNNQTSGQAGFAQCRTLWTSNGLTKNIWLNYYTNMISYENNVSHGFQITSSPIAYWNQSSTNPPNPISVLSVGIEANYNIGTENEGYANFSFKNNYLQPNNHACATSDTCTGLNLYQGYTYGELQQTTPSQSTCAVGLLPSLLQFDTYIGGQVEETWAPDLELADVPWFNYTASFCSGGNILMNSLTLNTLYNQALTQYANVLGYSTIQPNAISTPFTSTPTSVEIYMGFAPMNKNLMNPSNTGEIGLLSLAQTGICSTYDDGANVFTYYQSFCGTNILSSLPMGWTASSGISLTYGKNNVTLINTGTGGISTSNSIYATAPLSSNTAGNTLYTLMKATLGATSGSQVGVGVKTIGNIQGTTQISVGQGQPVNNRALGIVQSIGTPSGPIPSITPNLYEYIISNSISGNFFVNYVQFKSFTQSGSIVGTNLIVSTSNIIAPSSIFWIGTGNSAPNNVTPTFKFSGYTINTSSSGGQLTESPNYKKYIYQIIATDLGTTTPFLFNSSANTIIVYQALDNPVITLSNTFIDQGQGTQLTTSIAGGTPPYTYNLIIYAFNSSTSSILPLGNYLDANDYSTSNTYFWTPNANEYAGNTLFMANVVVTDSASTPVTENSVYEQFGYNSALQVTITPAANTILIPPLGQLQQWNAITTGGTPLSFTYNWQIFNSLGLIANGLYKSQIIPFNLFNLQPLIVGNYQANVYVTDTSTWTSSATALLTVYSTSTTSTTTTSTSTLTTTSTLVTTTIYQNEIVYIQNVTANPALTLPPNVPVICANTLGGSCSGTDVLIGANTLTASLTVQGNIIIAPGAVITTQGYSLIDSQDFNNYGIIYTGQDAPFNSGSINPINFPLSYGGSGGGGGPRYPAQGGNTLVPGGIGNTVSGSNVALISSIVNNANIIIWYQNNIANYLSSAGGNTSYQNYYGGLGVYGLYIQSQTANVGIINANGLWGEHAAGGGCAGGGGGGAIIIATLPGGYTSGTYNVLGGGGGTHAGGEDCVGGSGGIGQVYNYQYGTAPIPLPLFDVYYPLKLYTNATSTPFLNFSLYQTFNGVTKLLQANFTNANYTPPASQSSGIYSYNILEFQQSAGLINYNIVNLSVNMTDITNALTFNNPIIQYYPNLANFSLGSFTAVPSSWKLWSYPPTFPTAYGINTIQGSVFSSNLITNPVNIQLTYPFTSFNISIKNNPALQSSIVQDRFSFYPSNTGGNWIDTRPIMNISSYNEGTFNVLISNTSASAATLINNYSGFSYTAFNASNFQVYAPTSNYINPNIALSNITLLSKTVSYFQAVNNYCPVTLTENAPTNTVNYNPYLVDSNGAIYQFQVTTSGGSATNYYMVVQESNGAQLVQVGSIKIGTSPFGYPLEAIDVPYAFSFYNPGCTQIVYKLPLSVPISPIVVVLPLYNTSGYKQIPIGNATASCNPNTINSNTITITCSGVDSKNFITSWQTKIYQITTIYQIESFNQSMNATGSSFTFTSTNLKSSGQYRAIVLGCTGSGITRTCYTIYDQPISIGGFQYISPFAAGGALIVILILFTLIMIGGEIGLDMLVAFTLLGLFLADILGVLPLPNYFFYGIIAVGVGTIILMEV